MIAYRVATDAEQAEWWGDPEYDRLIGPDGFECFLGEREDRTWSRDGALVVDELNRLAAIEQSLARSPYDICPCMDCGKDVVCLPNGMARCNECEAKGGEG